MTNALLVVGGTVLEAGKSIEVLGSDGVWYRVPREKQFKDFKFQPNDVVWVVFRKRDHGQIDIQNFVDIRDGTKEDLLAMVA